MNFKALVCAAALGLAPVATSALTVASPPSYSTSDPVTSIFLLGPSTTEKTSGGSHVFTVTNTASGSMTIVFNFLSNFAFTGLSFTFKGNTYTDDFTAGMGAGEVAALSVNFTGATSNSATMSAEISAVPLPASAMLMFGALGGLSLLRRRKTA